MAAGRLWCSARWPGWRRLRARSASRGWPSTKSCIRRPGTSGRRPGIGTTPATRIPRLRFAPRPSWAYAAPRLYVSPFAWIDHGTCNCGYQAARTPAYVATQLAEFRKWGMGGEFADYAYAGLRGFDYTPYLPAMRAASTPGVVDSSPPTVAINAPRASAAPVATLALGGTTADNLAVRFVRWQNDRGGSGMAQLVWDVLRGDYNSGYSWRTRWSASIPVAAGQNR